MQQYEGDVTDVAISVAGIVIAAEEKLLASHG
jgi:hypothetical protein